MMRLDPSLILSRLIVLKGGERAYDERFHKGVNIIRGVPREGNSVGKSTIADFIFFALGGDLTGWKDEAALCDVVLAEVRLNGISVTLRREVSRTGLRPMSIFFGDFDAAQAGGQDGWQTFPYARVADRESFTQVLFRLMEMPEVPAEAASNITMHQVLRLMYVDQMTPVDRIFRFEPRDAPLRRQAVGDLLCGVFDQRIYPAQLRLREAESEYELASHRYKTLQGVLTVAGEGFNVDFVEGRRRNVEAEIEVLTREVSELKARRFKPDSPDEADRDILSKLRLDIDHTNAELIVASERVSALTYGIEDAAVLIDDINRTLKRLREGEITSAAIGPISFMFCPSCFEPLTDPVDENTCKLCRAPTNPAEDKSRTARMRNELEIQLKESMQLQDQRKEDLTSTRSRLAKIQAINATLTTEYLRISENYLTEADAKIDQLTSRIGFLERELISLAKEADLAAQLEELSSQRQELNSEISKLKEDIAAWKVSRDQQQEIVYNIIKRNTAYLLSRDLHTEAEFTADSNVYFDFAEDRITVNGKSGFSASSLTVLRNAFHLALHWSSCMSSTFRYPRFLLMDNIEDKGMTEARSQNFQRLIMEVSEQIKVEHQIIFTTSMIDPELDQPELTVGEKYDFDNKSLKIGQRVHVN